MGAFDGRVVFITGASSGIGAALALEFARQGADLGLAARRVDRLEGLAAELARAGRRAVVLPCDVTRDGDLEAAIARTREVLGRIDVVVANAGFGVVGPLDALTLADYRRQFETNVFGVLRTVYAALAELRRTRGQVVLLGSVTGYLSLPGASPYSMSKFALRALAQSLRGELAPDGIAVTLISPGFVLTEIHQVDNRGAHHPEVRQRVPAWAVMSAERAARIIVRGVARRRRELVITWLGRLAVFFERHLPSLVAWAVRRLGVRARPQPGAL